MPSLTLVKGFLSVSQAVADPAEFRTALPADLGELCTVWSGRQCSLTATSPSETGSPLCRSLSRCSSSAAGQLSYSTASLEEGWSWTQKIWAGCLSMSLRMGMFRWSLWPGQFCANAHLPGFGREHTQNQSAKKQRCCQMKPGETFL